jgi:hypothetical protein
MLLHHHQRLWKYDIKAHQKKPLTQGKQHYTVEAIYLEQQAATCL